MMMRTMTERFSPLNNKKSKLRCCNRYDHFKILNPVKILIQLLLKNFVAGISFCYKQFKLDKISNM